MKCVNCETLSDQLNAVRDTLQATDAGLAHLRNITTPILQALATLPEPPTEWGTGPAAKLSYAVDGAQAAAMRVEALELSMNEARGLLISGNTALALAALTP
jgi:hypothetical protein